MPRIIVLGAGVCGLAGALMMAREGHDVTVLERDPEPAPANPDEAWGVFSKSGKELDSELNKLAWKDTLPLLAADPTALDRERYTAFADFLVKRGLIKQAPPLDSYLREIK